MGKPRRSGLFSYSVLIVISGLAVATFSFADTSGSSSSSASAPASGFGPLGNYTPPAGTMPMIAPTNMCGGTLMSNPLSDQFSQLGAVLGGPSQQPLSCTAEVPDASEYESCDMYETNGSFNKVAGDKEIASLDRYKSEFSSCSAQLGQVQQQVGCLQNLETSMNQSLASFAQQFQAAAAQAQQAIQHTEQVKADVQNQVGQINQKLGGDQNPGGGKGLLDVQARLNAMINGTQPGDPNSPGGLAVTNADVVAWEQKHDAIVQVEHASFDSYVAQETMAQLNQCLTTPQGASPNLRCPGDSTTPVSAVQYVQCSYQRLSTANGSGQIDNSYSSFSNQQGQSAVNSLNVSLTSLMTTPDSPYNMLQAGSDPAQTGTAYAQLTINDVKGRYIGELPQSVQSYMSQWYDYCAGFAKAAVQSEINNPSSHAIIPLPSIPQLSGENGPPASLNQMKFALQRDQKTDQEEFNRLSNAYATEWQNDVNQVYGTSSSSQQLLQTAGCSTPGADPTSCFDSLRANMNQLLTGGPQIPFSFASNFPQPESQGGSAVPTVTCSGVNNCITALQNLRTERYNYQASMTQQEQTYANSAQSYLNNLLAQSASSISGINQSIKNQLTSMGAQLAKLGASASMAPGTLPTATLTPLQVTLANNGNPSNGGAASSNNGSGVTVSLMDPSTDVRGVLSGKVGGLVDLSQSYDGINQAIADATNKMSENEQKVAETESTIKAKEEQCAQDVVKTNMTQLSNLAQQFNSQNCGKNVAWCQANVMTSGQGSGGNLADLTTGIMNALPSYMGGDNSYSTIQSDLNSVSSACATTIQAFNQADQGPPQAKDATGNCRDKWISVSVSQCCPDGSTLDPTGECRSSTAGYQQFDLSSSTACNAAYSQLSSEKDTAASNISGAASAAGVGN